MDIWLTADTHFGHKNVIMLSKRPFKDVIEMDETMVENWNSTVRPEDTVYHLGDVFFRPFDKKRLNGNIIVLAGNHDRIHLLNRYGWNVHQNQILEISLAHRRVILCHYPIQSWNRQYQGSVHFHGHSHGALTKVPGRLDVGVDVHGFTPIHVEDAVALAKPKENGYANLPPISVDRQNSASFRHEKVG